MTYRQRILALLAEHGPMTLREMAADIGADPDVLRGYIGSLRNRRPGVLYIHSYRRDEDGGRLYPRALYALGNEPDAKPPKKLSRADYNRRAREKAKVRVASVFHLTAYYKPNQVKASLLQSSLEASSSAVGL